MKIGKTDKVLLPAYHCISMVEPVVLAGAMPLFYKILPNTSVDLGDVRSRIDGSTKLLIVVNYFGFPQNLPVIRSLCDEYKIFLLEDCAHAFFGEYEGRPLGSFGDYSIASCIKFFPIYEGGCIVSSRKAIGQLKLDPPGPAFEIKAVFNTLEKGFEYDRMGLLKKILYLPILFKNLFRRELKNKAASEEVSPASSGWSDGFELETRWLNRRSSFISRYLIRQVSKSRIASKRRENYIAMQEALAGLPGCSPLFPRLFEGVVPYVLPIITNEPEKIFPALKKAGVPVVRFGEFLWQSVDASLCPVSVDLSRRVMQFPCHQELKPAELDWMIREIRSVFLLQGQAKNDLEIISRQ
jgi:dTDP-4-amino-4,6-dideoxygalactose transaminase